MPRRSHLVRVARDLKQKLNGQAWLTIDRMEITGLIRAASGEGGTRLKSALAGDLEHALLEQGVRCHPSLQHTTTGDTVRLFHPGTVIASLVDILSHPDSGTDRELAGVTKKVKGDWNWQRIEAGDEEDTEESES